LEAPSPDLVRRIVEARLRPALEELPDFAELPSIFPFSDEQIERTARTEPTLRDMLQQFRHMFDRAVYGAPSEDKETRRQGDKETEGAQGLDRLPAPELPPEVKSLVVVEAPAAAPAGEAASSLSLSPCLPVSLSTVWDQEVRAARRK